MLRLYLVDALTEPKLKLLAGWNCRLVLISGKWFLLTSWLITLTDCSFYLAFGYSSSSILWGLIGFFCFRIYILTDLIYI